MRCKLKCESSILILSFNYYTDPPLVLKYRHIWLFKIHHVVTASYSLVSWIKDIEVTFEAKMQRHGGNGPIKWVRVHLWNLHSSHFGDSVLK